MTCHAHKSTKCFTQTGLARQVQALPALPAPGFVWERNEMCVHRSGARNWPYFIHTRAYSTCAQSEAHFAPNSPDVWARLPMLGYVH